MNFSEMLQNLGGDKDFNILLTRRMLFLLEGTWLYGEERFKSYRTDLLNKYIRREIQKSKYPDFSSMI